MSRFYCSLHPWEEIVGVCSACLRERLLNLRTTDKEPRRPPDLMSSCGCLNNRKRKNGGIYYKTDGIRNHDPGEVNWCDTEHAEKKGSKIFKFSGLRSLFGFMKKDSKNKATQVEPSQQEDRSGDVPQDFFGGEEGRKSWISSAFVGNVKAQFTSCSSSARQSVSLRRSVLKRSTSGFDKELPRFNPAHVYEQDTGKVLLYHSRANSMSRSWSMSRSTDTEVKCTNPEQANTGRKNAFQVDRHNNNNNYGGSARHSLNQPWTGWMKTRESMDDD